MTRYPLVRLDQVAEVRLGRQRAPKNHHGDHMRPYLRAANVGWSGLQLEDVKEMNFTDAELVTYRLQAGDLLLTEASGSPGEVGKPALWSGELEDCAFQNTLLRVRPHEHDPRYLLHFFRHMALAGRFVPEARGVGINHLGRARLAAWQTPVPALGEQRRIVEILEDHLSHLDAGGREFTHAQQRIAGMRLAVLHQLVKGATRRLGDIKRDADYGTSVKCSYDGRGVAVLRIPNLREGSIDRADLKFAVDPSVDLTRSMVAEGDVLIVRTNGSRSLIGRSAVVDESNAAAFASYLIRYRVDRHVMLPEWLHLSLESPSLRETIERLAASSAGQHNLSLGKLDSLELPVPSLDTQASIVATFSEFAAETRRLRVALGAAEVRGEALRRAVLTAAFEGKLTGRHTDDEVVEERAAAHTFKEVMDS